MAQSITRHLELVEPSTKGRVVITSLGIVYENHGLGMLTKFSDSESLPLDHKGYSAWINYLNSSLQSNELAV